MKHLDLFSGIGGFALAARWMGWETIQFVEIDKYCQKVLAKNFPNVPIHGDIKTFNGSELRGTVDILTGGPPCQPTSNAGQRKGEADDRWKWPEAIRVLGEVRPHIAVFENPDDLLTLDMGRPFERICCEMENLGYKIETYGIPAACVGAWRERDRVWIIAYNDNRVYQGELVTGKITDQAKGSKASHYCKRKALDWKRIRPKSYSKAETFSDTNSQRFPQPACTKFRRISKTPFTPQGCEFGRRDATTGAYWKTEPNVVRMVHGVPNRVDRIKGLGNAIVPQVAFEIFKAIEAVKGSGNMA